MHNLAAAYNNRAESCENKGNYDGAVDYYKSAADLTKKPAQADASTYEPYLYATYDQLCLIYYNHFRNISLAKQYEEYALSVARRCESRNPGRHSSDIRLFESRLRNDF